jgi:hypothetical protein
VEADTAATANNRGTPLTLIGNLDEKICRIDFCSERY